MMTLEEFRRLEALARAEPTDEHRSEMLQLIGLEKSEQMRKVLTCIYVEKLTYSQTAEKLFYADRTGVFNAMKRWKRKLKSVNAAKEAVN